MAARSTPAIFAALGVLLTYAVGRSLAGRDAGWWSALVLATSLLYFAHARILLTDMVVSVLICATLYCFLLAVREPPGSRRRWTVRSWAVRLRRAAGTPGARLLADIHADLELPGTVSRVYAYHFA